MKIKSEKLKEKIIIVSTPTNPSLFSEKYQHYKTISGVKCFKRKSVKWEKI